jgi:hypothetical protein
VCRSNGKCREKVGLVVVNLRWFNSGIPHVAAPLTLQGQLLQHVTRHAQLVITLTSGVPHYDTEVRTRFGL